MDVVNVGTATTWLDNGSKTPSGAPPAIGTGNTAARQLAAGTLVNANQAFGTPRVATDVVTKGYSDANLSAFTTRFRSARLATTANPGVFGNFTVTWPSAFADTAYTATCNAEDGQGVVFVSPLVKSAGSMTLYVNNTSGASKSITLACIAIHD
jgi:hypothetical protein